MKKIIKRIIMCMFMCLCVVGISGCFGEDYTGMYKATLIVEYDGDTTKIYEGDGLYDFAFFNGEKGIPAIRLGQEELVAGGFLKSNPDKFVSEKFLDDELIPYEIEENVIKIKVSESDSWEEFGRFEDEKLICSVDGVTITFEKVSNQISYLDLLTVQDSETLKGILMILGISALIALIVSVWFVYFASLGSQNQSGKSVWGWIGAGLLLFIPIVSIIMLFIWAFGEKTKSDYTFRSWARLNLIGMLFAIVFYVSVIIVSMIML